MRDAPSPTAPGFALSYRMVRPEAPVGSTGGRLLLLHGFFGSGRNWAAVARGVVRSRPDWEVVLPDLRLHGESLAAPPPHTIESCAEDIARLAASIGRPGQTSALLGHSFGGKVAMLAADMMAGACRQVWIVDSTPAPGPTGAGAAEMLELIARQPGPFTTRRAGADSVEAGGFPRFVAEWMATNLDRGPDGYRWRFELSEMRDLLVDFFATDLWRLVEAPPDSSEFRFVRATRHSILATEDAHRIARLESEGTPVAIQELEGGHWLNVDNPDGLVAMLRTGLPRA